MDFAEGILGDRRFPARVERPYRWIGQGRHPQEREVGKATSAAAGGSSRFILRRDKETVFGKGKAKGKGRWRRGSPTPRRQRRLAGRRTCRRSGGQEKRPRRLAEAQQEQQNLCSPSCRRRVFKALNETGSAWRLDVLRKICTHTDLLTSKAAEQSQDDPQADRVVLGPG